MIRVIVGDVHLTREGSQDTSRALAHVLRAHPDAGLVFAGDLFDLAAETLEDRAPQAIRRILVAHDALRVALAEHAARGGELTLIAGNHDDELVTTDGLEAFRDALGLEGEVRGRVRATPWFARLGPAGALHVEHGHHFDADNALPHPLAPPDAAWWSLGIGLMHGFIAPSGAHSLVHANDRTPLQAFWRTVELFGPRAPSVIARYFSSAAAQVFRAGRAYPAARARALGGEAVEAFSDAWGLSPTLVRALVDGGATPTLASARATFLRLYWDRVLATAVGSVAGASALLGGPGRRVAVGAAGVLVASVLLGRNRYRGRVQRALLDGAAAIAELTGARAVVQGHIHEPEDHGRYKNTGSFAFPGRAPGRPYVLADDVSFALEHRFAPRERARKA